MSSIHTDFHTKDAGAENERILLENYNPHNINLLVVIKGFLHESPKRYISEMGRLNGGESPYISV